MKIFILLFTLCGLHLIAQDDIDNSLLIKTDLSESLSDKSNGLVVVNKGGTILTAWLDTRNGSNELFYQLIDPYGNLIGENRYPITDQVFLKDQLDIAPLNNGNFALSWASKKVSNEKIFFTVIDSIGETVVPITAMKDYPRSFRVNYPSICAFGQDSFLLAFAPDTYSNSFLCLLPVDGSGNPLSEPMVIDSMENGYNFSNIDICVNGTGNILISAERGISNSDKDIEMIILSQSLEVLHINRKINPKSGDGFYPTCTALSNGNFAIDGQLDRSG